MGEFYGEPTDNIVHTIYFDVAQATELAPGVTLFTKNGAATGNAIIVDKVAIPPAAVAYLAMTNQKLWLVETDFGNRMKLTDNEITEMFNLGTQQDYDTWWDHRTKAIEKTVD